MKKILIAAAAALVFAAAGFAQARSGEVERGIFHQEGVASWYGAEFNGKPTASGELFNDSLLTAAHPILPFGTMLKITNQQNNKTVTVRVNDRGPFVSSRIIDVSRAAAQRLDMISTGTAPVTVESLSEVTLPARPGMPSQAMAAGSAPSGPLGAQQQTAVPLTAAQVAQAAAAANNAAPAAATAPATVPGAGANNAANNAANTFGSGATLMPNGVRFQPAIPEKATGKSYRVQVGAYKQPQHALDTYEKLKNVGLEPAYERYGDFYRVILSGLKQDELIGVSERLSRAGFKEALLREE